jgi:hypothetical protein
MKGPDRAWRIERRSSGTFHPASYALILACLEVALLSGCATMTDPSLLAARNALTTGDYATAHQELLAARNDKDLSDQQRREVADDLCLTEYKIGVPTYPRAEQLSVCREAASAGAGPSAALLSQIEATDHAAQSDKINQAIAHDDIAGAEVAIERYQTIPGGDPHAVSKWSQQLWTIVERQYADAAKVRRHGLQPAISRATRAFPHVHAMSEKAFAGWVQRNMQVNGTSLVSSVKVAKHTLTLNIPDSQMAAAAINLDRFTTVNDALVARCGCDGQTKVSFEDSELPAYVVRLDPATRRSEILVLAQH